MGNTERLMPLILCFLLMAVAVGFHALILSGAIDFDMKIIEQNFKHYNWNYSH